MNESLQSRRASAFVRWSRTKELVRKRLSAEDFDAFIRPLYLLWVLSNGPQQAALLGAPANRRIAERARNCAALREAAAENGFAGVFFTRYLTDDDLVNLRERAPDRFAFLAAPLQRRAEAVIQMRIEQDARDQGFAA